MPVEVDITVLVDNLAQHGLESEHGLSLWIETPDIRILFDTGQNGALEKNASTLGIEVSTADAIVLSHGHYDHCGGLPFAVRVARSATVYCHSAAVLPRYAVKNGAAKPVHMSDASKAILESVPESRRRVVTGQVQLCPNVHLTGTIPRVAGSVGPDWPFYLDAEATQVDAIPDDMALWIYTSKGLVLVLGCCHAGLANTLRYVHNLSRGHKIHCIIGGMHLIHSKEAEIRNAISVIQGYSPNLLVPLHCTGTQAVAILKEAFGTKVHSGIAGMHLQF